MKFAMLGPGFTAILVGCALYYLFRMLQNSDPKHQINEDSRREHNL